MPKSVSCFFLLLFSGPQRAFMPPDQQEAERKQALPVCGGSALFRGSRKRKPVLRAPVTVAALKDDARDETAGERKLIFTEFELIVAGWTTRRQPGIIEGNGLRQDQKQEDENQIAPAYAGQHPHQDGSWRRTVDA